MKWSKRIELSNVNEVRSEEWIRKDNEGMENTFPVDVFLGKKTNLLGLKKDIVKNIQEKMKYYNESRTELYQGDTEYVSSCPITGIPTDQCEDVSNIYGANYVKTPDTGHVFVKNRPTESTIHNFYLNNVTYAATYTNKSSAESRLNAIAVPWVKWMLKVYENTYGRRPKRILDVGSGAGHFVEACRREGLIADGIELSQSSRDFAKEIWGFEMDARDFIEAATDYEGYDVVTFWGLLEHTPNPSQIVQTAHSIVSKSEGGMVISKLPRWNSLSSAVQRLSTDSIIRHIDPMGHIMLFSDASAAELYFRNGFSPVSAWYYGMDIYEMLMQVGNKISNFDCLTKTGEFQVELQQFVDEVQFSDGLTIVGIPNDHS